MTAIVPPISVAAVQLFGKSMFGWMCAHVCSGQMRCSPRHRADLVLLQSLKARPIHVLLNWLKTNCKPLLQLCGNCGVNQVMFHCEKSEPCNKRSDMSGSGV
jgi:hypothetical protein